jgi:energy-coupling factor transporter ATP-binding protein EcfA2
MDQPLFKPNQDINLQDASNQGQIGQAGRDLTQIQARNVTFNQTQIIQIAIAEIKTRQLITASPYRGLEPFGLQDKDYFFGRDQFLTGLVNELESSNSILLLGASGSGKSSVVRAGLIPWIAQEYSSRLVNPIFTPDQDPFESFYASLLHQRYKQSEVQVIREGKADGLIRTVRTLKQPGSYWFIFIDQFEELFTTSQRDRRDAFVEGITRLIKMNDPFIKVMATMRADFLDRLSPYPELIKLTDKHRPIIAEMQRDELRLAIEQPAAHHGVVFEEGLVEEIIKDVQGQAGYLPLLQYTLNLLWETEVQIDNLQDRTLNINTYRRLGGIRGALQTHVDHIYAAFSSEEQLATQRIFLKLVGIGGDEESETEWKPIRRRANRKEFNDELEQRVLIQLIDTKLLVSDRQPSTQQSTVELAHEVLLTSWRTLNHWINENRQAIALRNRLNDDVARWQAKKAEDELWSGSKLEQALELRNSDTFNQILGGFNGSANQFIDASKGVRDRLLRQERQRKRWRTGMAIAFPTLVATFTLLFALQRQQSQKTIEAVFLDTNTSETFTNLPGSLQQADVYRRQVDQFNGGSNQDAIDYYIQHQAELNRAFAYYRQILRVAGRVQRQIQQNPDEFAQTLKSGETLESTTQTIDTLLQDAENSLATLIIKYRLPQLKHYLAMEPEPTIGAILPNTLKSDFENQYTEGALRTTYEMLMTHAGAGADLNGDGLIRDAQEASQLPCEVLRQIEELWRQISQNQCSWYTFDSDEYDPDCTLLDSDRSTLVSAVFDFPTDFATERLNQCGIEASPVSVSVQPDSVSFFQF